MTTRPRPRRLATVLPVALAGALALTACSGGSDEEAPAATGDTSASAAAEEAPSSSAPTAEPYLPVPDGVELTQQGSLLEVGDTATVAYEPRQDQVGVLDLTVDRLRETTFEESFQDWQLDAQTRASTPYFVDVTVRNEGTTDLGGRTVPLYLLDDANTLVEPSTFAGDFEPCPSSPLPERFRGGDRTKACLVFLAPEGRELAGVSFRPEQDFDAITWAGEVEPPPGEGGNGGSGNGGSGGGGGGGNGGGNGGG